MATDCSVSGIGFSDTDNEASQLPDLNSGATSSMLINDFSTSALTAGAPYCLRAWDANKEPPASAVKHACCLGARDNVSAVVCLPSSVSISMSWGVGAADSPLRNKTGSMACSTSPGA